MRTLILSAVLAQAAFPAFPKAVETRIDSGDLIAYLVVPDASARVAAFYAREWERRGCPTFVEGEVVSCFDTLEGVQWSVLIVPYRGKTVVLESKRDLRREVHPRPTAHRPE